MASKSVPPLCQWCRQPAQSPVGCWDGKPQCADPHACERRRKRRRANRLDSALTLYHAVTSWADDGTGESADPYCADCKTDSCRQWMRIETRLRNRRMELDGINPKRRSKKAGGWGGGDPW